MLSISKKTDLCYVYVLRNRENIINGSELRVVSLYNFQRVYKKIKPLPFVPIPGRVRGVLQKMHLGLQDDAHVLLGCLRQVLKDTY